MLIIMIMSTAELKTSLYKLIDSINDSQTLMAIYTLLSKKEVDEVDFWDKLSEAEKQAIEEGISEADRGELFSHEEVMAEIKSKFKV